MDQKEITNELARAYPLNKAISTAIDHLIAQQPQQAIDLMAPFYQEGQANNIQVIEILARAYAHVPVEKAKIFQLWYTLFKYGEKYINPDTNIPPIPIGIMQDHPARFVINALFHMINYTTSSARAIVFLYQTKNYLDQYPTHYTSLARKEYLYESYLTIATKCKIELENTADFTSRQAYFEKAVDCIKQALVYKENDLRCLLYWARISMSVTQNTINAFDILLPLHTQYHKNPNYLYALAQLYRHTMNNELAEKYTKEYEFYRKPGINDQLTIIFEKLSKDYCAEMKFTAENAIYLLNNNRYHEAKEIADELIRQNSQDYLTLETSAEIEAALKNNAQALATCEKILTINPKSATALKIKAWLMWDRDSDEHKKEAIAFSEHAYEKLGCRKIKIFGILIMGYSKYANPEKFLLYSSAYVKLEPSAWLYYYIGGTCIQLGKYPEAIDALEAARKQCNTYQPNEIAASLIFCHAILATTWKHYLDCAQKIRCYLANLELKTPNIVIIDLIKVFKGMGITITPPLRTKKKESDIENKTEELVVIPHEQESLVPPEIKERIMAAMNSSSFAEELPLDINECALTKPFELKVKPEKLVSIGRSGHLFGYISPHLRKKLSKVEWRQFTTALKTHRLLDESSENISGTKTSRKYPNIYKLKIIGDPRLFGKGHLFKELNIGKKKITDATVVELSAVMRNHRQKIF